MVERKYKIGDHVVVESSNIDYVWNYAGATGKVVKYKPTPSGFDYDIKIDDKGEGSPVIWCKVKCLVSEAKNEKIVITHDGKTTTATLYNSDCKLAATARCAPEDKFDFNAGAELAFKRLMEKVAPTEWRVVKRKPRVGDYIRLLDDGFSFDNIGDIHKVYEVIEGAVRVHQDDYTDHRAKRRVHGYTWTYLDYEFEVVEKVTENNQPEPVKYYSGTVVCTK